jgi:hypothetical protein
VQAEIVPVVLNGRGEALAVGRSQRLATPAQRAALRAMHRTCVGVTCDVPFDACQVHHVIPWDDGGPTDLQNLAPLCNEHHHLVHEGGWKLTLTPTDRHLDPTRRHRVPHRHHHRPRTQRRRPPPADELQLELVS